MHSHGKFDMSHFNVGAIKHHFGEGEFVLPDPDGFFVAVKE